MPHASPSRRVFLTGTAAAAGASVLLPSTAWATTSTTAPAAPRISDPFTLGVASGDPWPDGVVLWTRLAPEPLALDGRGGMPDRDITVEWQVAADEGFRKIAQSGRSVARPESGHSVHVELSGLRPGTDYFYRFRAEGEISPEGRTRTAPRLGSSPERFAFAFASCQNRPDGHYTAYAHMAREDLDLVAFLGDYIYEGPAQGSLGRGHLPVSEIFSLADYRVRHAQYRSDPDLQAAHAAFPWALVFDDHEVENNWASDISEPDTEPDQDRAVFLERRARAFQVYYEHMPLRREQRPKGPDMRVYRRLRFGDLMDFYMLDTRQYRDDQVPDEQRDDPDRTILGAEQRKWLFRRTAGRTGRWNVLAQQVFFSQRDTVSGPGTNFSDDAWDDYLVERDAVRDHLTEAGTRNPVVITGDVHASYVSDIKADFNDAASRTVGTELVGTSISSGGDGVEQNPGDLVQLAENPHIKYINRRRGYVRNVVTRDAWTATYRTVDFVTRPGAPLVDRATFTIEDGHPGVVSA
ncbi:MAG: alkaline phosphatase [Streptosporangiales bacterium]|nr:alkaline phosphatase [Streptosporangiales bacterium]